MPSHRDADGRRVSATDDGVTCTRPRRMARISHLSGNHIDSRAALRVRDRCAELCGATAEQGTPSETSVVTSGPDISADKITGMPEGRGGRRTYIRHQVRGVEAGVVRNHAGNAAEGAREGLVFIVARMDGRSRRSATTVKSAVPRAWDQRQTCSRCLVSLAYLHGEGLLPGRLLRQLVDGLTAEFRTCGSNHPRGQSRARRCHPSPWYGT